MKSQNQKDWKALLPVAVSLLNKRVLSKLGGLSPEQVHSFADDSIIREAKNMGGISQEEPEGKT